VFLPDNALTLGGTAATVSSWSLTNFSISFWIKASATSFLYIAYDASVTNYVNLRSSSSTPPYFRMSFGTTRDYNAPAGYPALSNGNWHHVAITRDSSTGVMNVYFNGQASPQNGLTVGTNTFSPTRLFPTAGVLDEYLVYDKVLTAGEVSSLYNGGAPVRITNYTNVYAAYHMNQTSGTTATDSSGNSRNATGITGATWVTGIVAPSTPQPLSDIPMLRIENNGISNSYGTLTLGYYNSIYGTSNIYEGLSHLWNVLGASKMTVTSSGVNISQYTGNLAIGSALSAGTTIAAGGAISSNAEVSAGTYFWGSAGAAGTPTYSFTTDKDTGAYSGGANIYGIATGGVSRFTVDGLGRSAWGTSISSAIFSRYSYSPTQLTTGTTILQAEGTHTQNADNAYGLSGNTQSVGLNTAGFNNTTPFASGGGLSGGYALVQVSSTPATGTVAAINGYRASVRNTGAGTVTDAASFFAMPILNSGGGTLVNAYGFYAGVMAGATNNYSFYAATTASANRWNLYMAGSAQNYMNGNLGLGTGKTVPAYKIDAVGEINADVGFRVNGVAGLSGTYNFDATTSGNIVSMTFTGGILTAVTTLP